MAGRRKDLGWFPMHAMETLADDRFQGWSCEERGAWLTLVLICWHEGSIPASPDLLRRTLHMDAPAFRVVWEAIGNRFAPSDEDPERLISPRLEKERAKANRIASERAKAGAEGGKAKAARARNSPSNCQANAKQNPSAALAKPAPTPTPTPTPRTTIPPQRARLVSPLGAADPYPQTSAVLAALFDRGLDAAPPSDKQAGRVEAAIAAVGVEAAESRLAEVYANPNAQKPLTFHVDAIRGQGQHPASPALPTLDATWIEALPATDRQRARDAWAELQARVKRSAYPDALPQLMAEARDHFQATWEAA